MFFHLEHHLFPRVPTCHLPALADRLQDAAPELSEATVY
jgi:fatty acid desaturase